MSTLTTSSTVSPLTGLISNSPQELVANSDLSQIIGLPFSAFLFNTSLSWQSGSAYMKTLGKTYGDRVYVYDCGSPITEGVDITPCPGNATTLEQIFPSAGSDGNTLSFNDGQITTLAGVRAWIANAALPIAETGILTYRMYYQNKGKIYKASLIKDGTLLQGPTTASTLSPHFNIYFNDSAIQSIKSALKF